MNRYSYQGWYFHTDILFLFPFFSLQRSHSGTSSTRINQCVNELSKLWEKLGTSVTWQFDILWALSHDLEVLYLGWCFHGDSFVCILTLFFSSYATSGWDFVCLMLGWVYKSRSDCTLEYLLIQLWMDVRTVIFYVRASNWTCPVLAYIHCFELHEVTACDSSLSLP
jgi:hypothetical protein